jgi:hypothetical protein
LGDVDIDDPSSVALPPLRQPSEIAVSRYLTLRCSRRQRARREVFVAGLFLWIILQQVGQSGTRHIEASSVARLS